MNAFAITPELYAGKGQRFANFLVDFFFRFALTFAFGLAAGVLSLIGYNGLLLWVENMGVWEEILLDWVLMMLYYVVIESLTQRTIGKFITGTMVVDEDGNKPDTKTIIVRSLCRFIPFEAFSFLGESTRGWHDSISKTYVVDVKKFEHTKNLKNSFEEIGSSQPY